MATSNPANVLPGVEGVVKVADFGRCAVYVAPAAIALSPMLSRPRCRVVQTTPAAAITAELPALRSCQRGYAVNSLRCLTRLHCQRVQRG